MHIAPARIACLAAALTAPATAQIISYCDRPLWEAAVGGLYETADFATFPAGTVITDQYLHLGIEFTDGNDTVIMSPLYVVDGWGLDGITGSNIEFSPDRTAIAFEFADALTIDVFHGATHIGTSDNFAGSGNGHFGGIVVNVPFDRVELTDWVDPQIQIDDMLIASHPAIGTPYCAVAVPNSTGLGGRISATGSTSAMDNIVILRADQLPPGEFGIFINSTVQGFVPNPGGSLGILCLSGAPGRYNGPGQVLNSGSAGEFSLILDLPTTPTPTGPVPVLAGQTWNFQCWYRDLTPNPSSNFTDGLTIAFL